MAEIGPEFKQEKAASPNDDINEAFEEFIATFTAFRDGNDARLNELEKRGSADILTEERLKRIESSLQKQEDAMLRMSRPLLPGSAPDQENKAALEAYIRKGRIDGYQELERKGMSVGSEADGGYLVPEKTEKEILEALRAESPMRAMARTLTISSSAYKRPFAVSGAGAGWIAETGLRDQTTTPQLAELAFPTMELYACPAAAKQLLDDAVVDVEDWIAEEINAAFGEQESAAFITATERRCRKEFSPIRKNRLQAQASAMWASSAPGRMAASMRMLRPTR